MTKKKVDINAIEEMLKDMDKASEGAALIENDNVEPIKIERDRSPTKGNNKLITSLPESLEVDFYDFDLPKMVVPEPPKSTRNIQKKVEFKKPVIKE